MFSMPAQHHILSQDVEGCSDENPIRLYGESVERFRALLSVIYDLYVQRLSVRSNLTFTGGQIHFGFQATTAPNIQHSSG